MDKETILKKAQSEGQDELEVYARDQSMRWTYLAMVIAAAFFAYIRDTQGLPMMDLCATVCFSVFVGQLYRFIKTKDKWRLFLAAVTLIFGIIATVRFFMGH